MSSWDDVEVDSDGDELLDWLWDIPDRYDVGVDDQEGDEPGGTRRFRARPAEVADPFNGFAPDHEEGSRREPVTLLAYGERAGSRRTARDFVAVAGVVLVVAGGLGIGYRVFSRNGSTAPKQSNLAVGTPTTAPVPTYGQTFGLVPAAETTTTSVPPTTEAVTTSSVAAVIVATPSTTAARRTTTTPPTAASTTTTTTTTTTTVPPTTTTEAPTTTSTSVSTTTSTTSTSATSSPYG